MIESQSTPFSVIRNTYRLAEQTAIAEVARVRDKLAHKQKPWDREYRSVDAYERTFAPVLEGEGLVNIFRHLKAAKKPGEKFVCLDIMGTGSVFDNLPEDARPDIVIAITLVDYRTAEEKQKELQNNIYVLGTDKDDLSQRPTSVALPHTWIQFENLLKELNISTIDFAVARPLGGMHTIPADQPWLWRYMTQRVYHYLNPQGGMLLTEAPQRSFDFLQTWADHARQKGLDVLCRLIYDDPDFRPRHMRPALKFVKHPDSPEVIE